VSRLPAQLVDDAEDADDFLTVPDHVTVAGLAPAKQAVAVDDEGRSVGDVPLHVVDAVGLDDLAVDIAQEREGEAPGLGERLVGERAIPADREERDPATFELAGDLSQAGQLGRSDTAPVVAVEREDHVGLAPVLGEGDGAAERRGQREFGPRRRHPPPGARLMMRTYDLSDDTVRRIEDTMGYVVPEPTCLSDQRIVVNATAFREHFDGVLGEAEQNFIDSLTDEQIEAVLGDLYEQWSNLCLSTLEALKEAHR